MRRLIAFAPVLVFVLLLVGFAVGLGRDPSLLPSMMIGKPVPAFTLPAVRAGDAGLQSADLSGEPMLLNAFASWCAACQIEHPMLMRLKAEGVPIHGLDWKDQAADGAQWLLDRGDPYRKAGNDLSGRAGIDLGVSAVPETFVIDRQGKIRYRHVGAITPEVWAKTLGPLMTRLKAES
jgi:cytochrome c biogenesis protein CcmG/thiol:disulfide interchange protein DsbE